jgi:polysaccharide pyruvyl transferase WcaK-like protein
MSICWLAASSFSLRYLARGRYPFRQKLVPFLWADLVASVGAERINDKYFKTIVSSLYTYALIRKLGKKLVILPSTIGPFFFGWSRWLAKRVLRKVDLIYTRDQLSEEITRNLIGPGTANIVKASDVAVIQEWVPREEALAMIPAASGEQIVGISAMRWSYFKNRIETPFSNYGAYVREMAKLADSLMREFEVRVVFYPTNYPVHGCREDDLAAALEIRDHMECGNGITVIEDLPTPAQLKGMLACSELNITTRMHACILSTGAAVPTISINYLFKVREHMRSLGLDEFAIDIEEFNAEWALGTFKRVWPEREKWREHIRREIERKGEELVHLMERVRVLVGP